MHRPTEGESFSFHFSFLAESFSPTVGVFLARRATKRRRIRNKTNNLSFQSFPRSCFVQGLVHFREAVGNSNNSSMTKTCKEFDAILFPITHRFSPKSLGSSLWLGRNSPFKTRFSCSLTSKMFFFVSRHKLLL